VRRAPNGKAFLEDMVSDLAPYYVYLYRDAAGVPIYVGKGKGQRAWQHRVQSHNSDLQTWIVDEDLQPEILRRFADEAGAFAREIKLIAQFGRICKGTGTLLNVMPGGGAIIDGVPIWPPAELLNDPEFIRSCLERRKANEELLAKGFLRNAKCPAPEVAKRKTITPGCSVRIRFGQYVNQVGAFSHRHKQRAYVRLSREGTVVVIPVHMLEVVDQPVEMHGLKKHRRGRRKRHPAKSMNAAECFT
jgi:hypothetical protein